MVELGKRGAKSFYLQQVKFTKQLDRTRVNLAFYWSQSTKGKIFDDLDGGISEISRITASGKIVIFAFEQGKISDFWLTNYFPYLISDTLTTFPTSQKIAHLISQITQKEIAIIPFSIPANLSDLFAV
jgi:hypothetical protein